MQIREAVAEYRHAHLRLSTDTQRNHKQRLAMFTNWCEQQGLTLEALTARHVRSFLEWVSARPGMKTPLVRSSTVKTYAASIKAFLRWCEAEGFDVSPKVVARVELPRVEQTVIEVFSPEQIELLFAAAEKQPYAVRDKALLCVLLDTGARASEVIGLTLDCVWLDADDSYILVHGKGKKDREIALGRKARIALRRYITRYRKPATPKEQHVFLAGNTGKPLTRSGLFQIVAAIGRKAHIKGVRCSPHTARHTFACQSLMNGTDVYKLSRQMGHSSIRVTERYLGAIKAKQARQGLSVLDHLMKDL